MTTPSSVRSALWGTLGVAAVAVGLYAGFVRFTQGLGAVTNLSDAFPWGLWVGFDVLVGVGLAAGGFTITATVHLFNLERFRPIVRPTVLTAFLGYLLVIAGLMFDLGRPHRIWHPIIMWNPHSVMFEVAWCVTFYTTVLALEFSPMVLERLRNPTPLRIVRAITIPVVIMGVILSTLHQSSLGTLYVILPDKLHPLWYSPFLPVFFFMSAIAAGLSMVSLESFMSARAFGRRIEMPILTDLARVVVVILGLYLVALAQGMAASGAWRALFEPGPERYLFGVEILFGAVVPMVMLAVPAIRTHPTGLFCGSLLVVLGFIINRLNVATAGLGRGMGADYFPSFLEISVTAMLIVLGFVAFRLAVKHLRVFPSDEPGPEAPAAPAPTWVPVVSRASLAVFGLVLLAGTLLLDDRPITATPAGEPPAVSPPTDVPNLPDVLELTSPEAPGPVLFSHETHVEERACATCHGPAKFSILRAAGTRKPLGEAAHDAKLCGGCHNSRDAFGIEDDCEACHAP